MTRDYHKNNSQKIGDDRGGGQQESRRNRRQHDLRVTARGVRRSDPDIGKLTRTSLDFYLATREQQAENDGAAGEVEDVGEVEGFGDDPGASTGAGR